MEKAVDEITQGISNRKDVAPIKDAISPHWAKVKEAVKATTQIAQAKPGKVSVTFKAGAKGPTFGGPPQAQTGFDVQMVVTFTW